MGTAELASLRNPCPADDASRQVCAWSRAVWKHPVPSRTGSCPTPAPESTARGTAWEARPLRAHLTGSFLLTHPLAMPRGGAVAARWAHNPEVVGSNPTPATRKSSRGMTRALLFYLKNERELCCFGLSLLVSNDFDLGSHVWLFCCSSGLSRSSCSVDAGSSSLSGICSLCIPGGSCSRR